LSETLTKLAASVTLEDTVLLSLEETVLGKLEQTVSKVPETLDETVSELPELPFIYVSCLLCLAVVQFLLEE
jgi:hypothetical protein